MSETRLVAHDSINVIAAGGIAAIAAKVAEDQRTSPVTARAYKHPALDEGVVVIRLEPDAVAAGIDAEMVAFGFSEAEATKPLGKVRSRTLGFPGWALVHEPKKAKAALDVTEDMRKAKRLVSSKPGHAKDAFEKIAKQLQRTAPMFLPHSGRKSRVSSPIRRRRRWLRSASSARGRQSVRTSSRSIQTSPTRRSSSSRSWARCPRRR
jgi:hypothetical protein